jgi:hypothetical protein
MSSTDEPEPGGPHDPMHCAPQRLREEPEQRLAAADDIRALREGGLRPSGARYRPWLFSTPSWRTR